MDLPPMSQKCRSMLSSKGLKTMTVLPQPKLKKLAPVPTPFPQYNSLSLMTNTLALSVSQPGLPSWWSLAAPQLNWVSTFVKHLSWALLVLNPTPLLVSNDSKLKTDWMSPSDSLMTLTRGPMASKKSSSVQFMLPKRPLQLRLTAKTQDTLGLSKLTLSGGLKQMKLEEGFWLEAWPTPTTVAKSTLTVNVSGLGFLMWK